MSDLKNNRRVAVLSAEEAAAWVRSGDTVAVSGCVWSLVPEELLRALEGRFLQTGEPRDLTELHLHVYGMGPEVGLERFAHEGMVKRVIGGSFAPPYWFKGSRMNALIEANAIEVFVMPAGVIAAQLRETGAGRPGLLSEIGLGSFVDPRQDGGTFTDKARESGYRTVELTEVGGREYLFYPSQKPDVAFIRATTADEHGNLSLEGEPVLQSVVDMAMAAKASGGRVIAQVKHLVEGGSIDPRLVQIPDIFVDAVVVVPEQRMFEYGVHEDHPAFVGDVRDVQVPSEPPVPAGAERCIAARAALEVEDGAVINLGAGIPVNVMSKVLREQDMSRRCTLSVEHGSLGGVNLGEFLCQTHWNPTSMMSSTMTFDMYAGGGLDAAFLGMGEVDEHGNVNVTKVGDALAGIGGFMDIAQSARKVAFCGTLTYGGLRVSTTSDGRLSIDQEGRAPKFVKDVGVISLSGAHALARGQRILYITERCVFELTEDGLLLTDVAPGIDPERDIAPVVQAAFRVAGDLRVMPASIYEPAAADAALAGATS